MNSRIPNQYIDAVFVLSVRTFTDRIAHIQKELKKHDIDFDFIFEHDLNVINNDLEEKIFGPAKKIEAPQRSLVLKHIEAWKKCISNQYKNILIFEDDVVLHRYFCDEINSIMADMAVKDSAYLIFLGGADTRVPKSFFLNKEKVIINPIATADGYITDLNACKKRLSWLERNCVKLPADHLLKFIDQEENITQYWSYKPLVQQGSVFGMFVSELDRKRKNKSNFYNLIRYNFKRVTRRIIPSIYYRLISFIKIN